MGVYVDNILLESAYKLIKVKHIMTEKADQMMDFNSKWSNALTSSEELSSAVELMKNIKDKFPSGEIYIVGGVPRDLLLGKDIADVDLSTNIPFNKLKEFFELRDISKNESQPVYTIKYNDFWFDLAQFRTDSDTVGRSNNISQLTNSFEEDTKRRDLTINSFGMDENGKLVDYQNGLEDLENKIIRAVGDPKKRFMEDATRILRVFRFAAKMGFEIDPNTSKAATDLKHLLTDRTAISMESISKELYKSASSGKTLKNFLQKLDEHGILEMILPEFTAMKDASFTHNPVHHPEGGSTVLGHIYECLTVSPFSDPVINLAVLFHDFGKAVTLGSKNGQPTYHGHEAAGVPIVERIFERLRFSELSAQDKKNILSAVGRHMLIHNISQLNTKTLSELILSPAWNVVKSVGYCDEASRGASHFNKEAFDNKIKTAEDKIKNIGGGSSDELRKKVKTFIDGNKLMNWFPELKSNLSKMAPIMNKTSEYILDELDKGRQPSENDIKEFILKLL